MHQLHLCISFLLFSFYLCVVFVFFAGLYFLANSHAGNPSKNAPNMIRTTNRCESLVAATVFPCCRTILAKAATLGLVTDAHESLEIE